MLPANVPFSVGLEIVGDVPSTGAPEPVAALARPAATPVPSPDTPVAIGSPVPFVSVMADGVPRLGVTSVGEFDSTAEPVPVNVVVPVPPFGPVSGFCSVRLLNVGDGYVCPKTIAGTASNARRIFFMS
ncbi:hypothetical protein [Burkholderia ambifaria]|uniref:hypothetical protein n=1 Tax=Burkholderia ambifaria TaxID=152480 RepID=UPI00158C1424|nr:hypothetical protein [Burkholderia ambifaria]